MAIKLLWRGNGTYSVKGEYRMVKDTLYSILSTPHSIIFTGHWVLRTQCLVTFDLLTLC